MEWYSLQQTAEHYHVTKSTVSDWRKTDKITYSGGGRVFVYQWDYPKFDKPAEPEKKSQSEADKIREQIEIEKLKKELAMVKQDNQIEPKTTLVTIDEERQVIIDDANKQAARTIEEAADTARLKAQEIINNARSQAEVILNEAQEAIDRAEQSESDIQEREQALSQREEEHEALVEKHMAWKKRQEDMYNNEWQSRIDLELQVRESLTRTMCRDCKYNKGVK